jgi:hypothetical protein
MPTADFLAIINAASVAPLSSDDKQSDNQEAPAASEGNGRNNRERQQQATN